MFTGIVDHCGEIRSIEIKQNKARIQLVSQFENLVAGESISVDGCCLTVIEPQQGNFFVDLSPETMALTTARNYRSGTKVNLERALRLEDRLGGHCVTGHIDQCAEIFSIRSQQEFVILQVTGIDANNLVYLPKKGSVAVNGVSLTINNVFPNGFDVTLIPHTLQRTNLSELREGDKINLEYDTMTRVVVNYLQQMNIFHEKNIS